jgi:hypothetical protein
MTSEQKYDKLIGILVITAILLIAAVQWGASQTRSGSSVSGTVISGSDLGFRVDERIGDVITGSVVVRINGEWFATGPARIIRPAPASK